MSTRRLFSLILFLAFLVMSAREIADPDSWWHLRTGQYILETGSIPHSDIYSFTNANATWITHEWFSEVVIFGLYTIGGFGLLIVAFSFIIALTFALVYARCEGKPYSAGFIAFLAALATAPTWGARPQMLSLLLTSIFLFILDRHVEKSRRDQNDKAIWLLVPLTILWVNLHSSYALGIAIVAIYFGGELASRFKLHASCITLHIKRHSTSTTLALILALCLAVVPLNPNGATMYFYPFETLASRAMQTYIQEWFSPDFHLNEFQPFAILLLTSFASFAFARKRATLTDLLLLAGFAYAALRSARHIPIFALIAAPVLAANVWDWLQARGWHKPFEARADTPRTLVAVNWLILLLILLASGIRVVSIVGNQKEVERAKFPSAAVDFLQKEQLTTPIYNVYGWGGYLIWRRYPAARVFIDGRADVYGDKFIEEFLKTYRGEANWREPLDRYGVKLILVEPDAPLLTPLAQDSQWKKIFADEQAVIYQRE